MLCTLKANPWHSLSRLLQLQLPLLLLLIGLLACDELPEHHLLDELLCCLLLLLPLYGPCQ